MPDEIIEELWQAKDAIAREHGHDVRKLAAYLQTKNPGRHGDASTARVTNEHVKSDTPVESQTTSPG